RAAFAWVTRKLKGEVSIPLCTTNRINDPAVAERVLAGGAADMVSMARPLLADPEFVRKAAAGRADEINTCIACNQACLDHVFSGRMSSCLVNPRACHETELEIRPAPARKRVAVVGAGPAGLACATTLAERGHEVDLFDGAGEVGGQFNMARRIPGKEEFHETIRYFRRRLETTGVRVHLSRRVAAADLAGYDEVVLATGVTPRDPRIPGQDDPRVLSYVDVLRDGRAVGPRVAVVGAGGIGFDVAEFLVDDGHSPSLDLEAWRREWGVGDPAQARGGVAGVKPQPAPPARQVFLLQRKKSKPGAGLGKTTGWIHRAALKMKRVEMLSGVNYEGVVEKGLAVSFGEAREKAAVLEVDTIVLCAGQESLRELEAPLRANGASVHLIGGAALAGELDAKRAIDEGTRLGARL
ncbi:MAG: FAD-dependent oxidoreductase, partial [Burkholderiales bacterium]|nr:FAD-dependent oxidoreductase [Burkholderiales bacterium]